MKIYLAVIAMSLMITACHSSHPAATSDAYAPSPHYGNLASCPGSATSIEGGNPTPHDCVPGGTE